MGFQRKPESEYMYTEFFEPHCRGDQRLWRRQVDDTDRFNQEKNHGVEHDTSIGFDDMHNVGWMPDWDSLQSSFERHSFI